MEGSAAQSLYRDFVTRLDRHDREGCISLALSSLSQGEIDIVCLYDRILAPALRETICRTEGRELCVWEEHVTTSIVRTVLECCYPAVVDEGRRRCGRSGRGEAMVVCPREEFHEIGARMVADFFTLCGFTATFVGANTPQEDILKAIRHIKPAYVAISVSSSYNLVAARRTAEQVLGVRNAMAQPFTLIVGGTAFERNPGVAEEMGADLLLHTFEDIRQLVEKEHGCSP